MSWLDRIKNTRLEITTGDGVKYTPLWRNAEKLLEFNVSMFEFKDVEGTLVHRGMAKGMKYDVELIFQGADHLISAANFEASARNRGAWQISHPLYGQLYVQPVSLRFDNKTHNITRINGVIVETLGKRRQKVIVDPVTIVQAQKAATDAAANDSYLTQVPSPKLPDVVATRRSIGDVYNNVQGSIKDAKDWTNFHNAYQQASTYVDQMLEGPDALISAVASVQQLMIMPFRFADSVKNRLQMLQDNVTGLAEDLTNTTLWSLRKLYELTGVSLVSSMAGASVDPSPDDYQTRNDVLDVISVILDAYNGFLDTLDEISSDNYAGIGNYLPDPEVLTALSNVVDTAVIHLFDVANNALQERSYVLDEDSNVISVAYKLYGLKDDDSTIDRVIRENGITGEELLWLKKGREIVYYV